MYQFKLKFIKALFKYLVVLQKVKLRLLHVEMVLPPMEVDRKSFDMVHESCCLRRRMRFGGGCYIDEYPDIFKDLQASLTYSSFR